MGRPTWAVNEFPEFPAAESHVSAPNPVRDSWVGFLESRHWTHFATFTTRFEAPSLPQLRRALSRFATATRPQELAWFTEYGGIGGRAHAHGLLRTDRDPAALWEWWHRRYGRVAIEIPRKKADTTRYCSKYLTKRHFDYDYVRNDHDLWLPSRP